MHESSNFPFTKMTIVLSQSINLTYTIKASEQRMTQISYTFISGA